jgi:hypothetical protein
MHPDRQMSGKGAVMKKLIGLSIASLAAVGLLAAAPAMGQPEKKTELVKLGGESVDSMLLRYAFDATWVVDSQNILLRDTYRDHYLVSLKDGCDALVDIKRSFKFVPALTGSIRAGRTYEVRNSVGAPCDIVKIEQIDDARAQELRAAVAANG